METKEYIVTLKQKDDLNQFYKDMESKSYTCSVKRPLSRNTHYYLTEEQAKEIEKDERVLACEEPFDQRNIETEPCGWEQKYRFAALNRIHKVGNYPNNTYQGYGEHPVTNNNNEFSPFANNGLLFVTSPHPKSSSTSHNQPTMSFLDSQDSSLSSGYETTLKSTVSGKNVDVVIVDSPVDPNHVEFSVNADGTGGSRVNQINWFSFTDGINNDETNFPGVNYTTPSNYPYTNIYGNGAYFMHGTMCAGVAAGNLNGVARDANIYTLDPYSSNPYRSNGGVPSNWPTIWPDYIRYFHLNKSINSETGRRNPTICNMSFTYTSVYLYHESLHLPTTMEYQGSTVTLPTSTIDCSSTNSRNHATGVAERMNFLMERNVTVSGSSQSISSCQPNMVLSPRFYFAERVASLDADLEDMINDGIIIVAAAGNNNLQMVESTDVNYDNSITFNSTTKYFHRGGSPAAASNVICVGANQINGFRKAAFSNYGSRIDIWTHGQDCIGPWSSESFTATETSSHGLPFDVPDGRNSNHYQTKQSGTSFASPNIVGVLAGLLEIEPTTTQAEARKYLEDYKIESSTYTGYNSATDLTGQNPSKSSYYWNILKDSTYEFDLQTKTDTLHKHQPYQITVPNKRPLIPNVFFKYTGARQTFNTSFGATAATFKDGLTIYPHDTYKSRTPTALVNGIRYPRTNTRITKST